MPTAAAQECRSPLCGNYAEQDGYCPAHYRARPRDEYAGNLNPANRMFRRLRHSFLVRHPFCNHCAIRPATELDHIVPHKGDSNLFWRQSNWQGLCIPCHGRKTLSESLGNYPAPIADSPRHLIVLMGAPGAGKSTYAAKYPHVVTTDRTDRSPAPDRGEVSRSLVESAYRSLAHHLQMDHEVVFDTAATSHPAIREQALALARAHRARTTLVLFTAPADELCLDERQATRDGRINARRIHRSLAAVVPSGQLASEGWTRILTVDGSDPMGDLL
jgi:5-methylcytosine-specific restriction protein A